MKKKAYIVPASQTTVLAPATMLAASLESNDITVNTTDEDNTITQESDAWSNAFKGGASWDE